MAKKKSDKKIEKNIQKGLKKVNKVTLIFVVFFAILGLGAGIGTMFLITKNDVFEIVGPSEITVKVGEEYIEQGINAIAFGKDISPNVQIKGQVDTQYEGSYVLEYRVNHIRYKNHVLYKLVTVLP